ncbi:MAG TPA: hypothetical protein VKB57_18150 [Acidimicrobiales bacterium]|nr:hypothetical protein [Acidimicrobiales bacterium]
MDAEFVNLTWGGDDGDGIGRLTVTASANGYAGRITSRNGEQAAIEGERLA